MIAALRLKIRKAAQCLSGPLFLALVLPISLMGISGSLHRARGPHYVDRDPTYSYLMNSLSVLNGYSPFHRDHPGTPVQILGALTLRLAHPTLNVSEITNEVITLPEKNIEIIRYGIMAICVLLQIVAGYRVSVNLGDPMMGVIFQMIPWVSLAGWEFLTSVTSDLLLLSLSVFFFSFLTLPAKDHKGLAAVLGFVFGILLFTKVTSAVLGLIPVCLFLKKPRELLRFFCFFGGGVVIGAFPLFLSLRDNLGFIFHWVLNNAIHKKQYGEGNIGLITFREWMSNVGLLFRGNLLVPLALLAAVFFRKNTRLVLAALCIVIEVSVIAKNPRNYYLIPVFGAVSLILVQALQGIKWRYLSGCVLLLFGFVTLYNYQTYLKSAPGLLGELDDIEALNVEAQKQGCALVYSAGSFSREYALSFSNSFSGMRFLDRFAERYPALFVYDEMDRSLLKWNGKKLEPEAQAKLGPLCVVSQHDLSSKLTKIRTTSSGESLFAL